MDRNNEEAHAEWSTQDVEWDGVTLTAQAGAGADASVPTIDKYYIKGRGASSGSAGGGSSASCRVPGCTSDLSRDLAYFRKYRICREHLKSPVLLVEGVPSRFCQQCSRFHHVKEFDGPQRTCRAMLERLRLKRNSTKNSGTPRSGGRGKDTGGADASRRGGSSSRSNSTGKDAELPQDLAAGQQRSPLGVAPSDSGEGVGSVAVPGGGASRRSVATSAATASSLPGPGPSSRHHQQLLDQLLQEQAPPRRRPQQAALSPTLDGDLRGFPGGEHGAEGMTAVPRPVDPQDLLRMYLSQDAGLLPQQRHNQPHADTLEAAARLGARAGRNAHMSDAHVDWREGGVSAATAPDRRTLYSDAPYGRPPGDSMAFGDLRGAMAAAAAAELQSQQMTAAAPPPQQQQSPLEAAFQRRSDREILLEVARGGSMEDSLLLQLAIPRPQGRAQPDHDHMDVRGQQRRVLDLGQPPPPVAPVLNLGSRVDLSLELQLQDIYREEPPRLRLVWRLGNP